MLRRKPHLVLVAMALVIIIPAAITLNTVESPGTLEIVADNPTPLGYTWSLLLFLFPLTVLALFFLGHPDYPLQRGAFWKTVAVLTPLGFALDILFGNAFFRFENRGAVSGIDLPAVGGGIPVEEFIFYFSGTLLVLLLYIWNDEYWVAAYNGLDYEAEARRTPKIVQFHLESVVFGLVLCIAAVVYKKFFSSVSEGLPLYFTYLVLFSIIPSAGFLSTARKLINWRAFSVTFLMISLISLIWEATLAVPYNWWNYNPEMMIGIFIGAWHKLPIEAVLVWLAVTYTAVILYEVFKLYEASKKPVLLALFGTQQLWTSLVHDARTLFARTLPSSRLDSMARPVAEASGVVTIAGAFDVEEAPLPGGDRPAPGLDRLGDLHDHN